jgi:hypothetical protein
MSNNEKWFWGEIGRNPSDNSLYADIFSKKHLKIHESILRESIQNSLDARVDTNKPVEVHFELLERNIDNNGEYFTDLMKKRKTVDYDIPDEWKKNKLRWLKIQDFNASGLEGDVEERNQRGDIKSYWDFWYNWGTSNNKSLGGRGQGRRSFLIASKIQTVLGYTRRYSDNKVYGCGMSLLKSGYFEDQNKTSYALLAKVHNTNNDILAHHDLGSFKNNWAEAFQLTPYKAEDSGLAVIIPYPSDDITLKSLNAGAIEHFAPAIISGDLSVKIDHEELNMENIYVLARQNREAFNDNSIKEDPKRFIELIKTLTCKTEHLKKHVLLEAKPTELEKLREKITKKYANIIDGGKKLLIEFEFPLKCDGKEAKSVSIKAVCARTPEGKTPIDSFYRRGMSLPQVGVRKKNTNIDIIISVEDNDLSRYLNLFECASHESFEENAETIRRYKEAGFYNTEKRFINNLGMYLKKLITPNIDKPDSTLFSNYFSIPTQAKKERVKPRTPKDKTEEIEKGEVEVNTNTPVLRKHDRKNGFKFTRNPDHNFEKWPRNIKIKVNYNTVGKKKWSKFDFTFETLQIDSAGCDVNYVENTLFLTNCSAEFFIEVRGFDTNRELIVKSNTSPIKDKEAV